MGNLFLSFVIVWAYMCWFQYMLVWMANLPVDVAWYMPRLSGPWLWMALLLLLFGFVVPMPLLLFRAVKRSPRALIVLSGVVLVVQLGFMIYLVEPAFAAQGIASHWMDFVAPLAVGGLWVAMYMAGVESRPLLPLDDPNAELAAHLRESDEREAAWEEGLSHG